MNATAQIEAASRKVGAIDKRIDAVRAELLRNAPVVDELSAHDWQASWDCHPVLRAIERELFIRRADAADVRDSLIGKQAKAEGRRADRSYRSKPSWKPCPTCGNAYAVQVAA